MIPQTKLVRKIIAFDASVKFSSCHDKQYRAIRTERMKRRDDIIEEIVKLDIEAEKYLQNYKVCWEELWNKFLYIDTSSSDINKT